MQCSSLRSKDSFAVLIPSSIADAADATDIHVRHMYCLVHAVTLKLLGKRPNKVCDNERTASWLPQYTEMSRNHLARSGLRHLNAGPGWMRLAVTATIFSYIPHLKILSRREVLATADKRAMVRICCVPVAFFLDYSASCRCRCPGRPLLVGRFRLEPRT